MTMMNENRKRQQQQLIQQIRDLARNGDWQEAKRLADTLPDTPDNAKMKERIEKQLFIATGEVPAVMEGSMALLDSGLDEALLEGVPVVTKRAPKRVVDDELAPNIANAFLQFLAFIALVWGGVTFFTALTFPGRYSLYGASAPQMTQVYTQATFLMVQAIALFVFAGVMQLAIMVSGTQWLRRNRG